MSNNNSIVFINQSSGYLMVDIINAFESKYDNIKLITGDLNLRNNQISKQVRIKRIISPKRNSSVQRLLTWTIGFLQILWYAIWKSPKTEFFIVSNPPLVVFLAYFINNPINFLIFDVYPDALVDHNIIRQKSLLTKIWAKTNNIAFKKARRIYTLTEGMKSRIGMYCDQSKIKVVPIWTDNDFFYPIPREENIFLKENGIKDQTIVMYSGNLGYTHEIEFLADIAKRLENSDIEIYIIGEGARKETIKSRIKELKVTNCHLLPWQEMDKLPYSFSAAHIGVVSLGNEASSLSLPSKTFNYMSVGKPILCIASKKSELAKLVDTYDIGETFTSNDLEDIANYIFDLTNNQQEYERLSRNSLRASKDFTPKNAKMFLN